MALKVMVPKSTSTLHLLFTEAHYSQRILDKKLLAIKKALEERCHSLEDAQYLVRVYTDHKAVSKGQYQVSDGLIYVKGTCVFHSDSLS